VRTHELLDSDSSDEESVADLEVNVHKFKHKIQGLLEFSDSDDEKEQDPDIPATMEEAQRSMRKSFTSEHMASHHPSKRQLISMEQMQWQTPVTKALLVNKN